VLRGLATGLAGAVAVPAAAAVTPSAASASASIVQPAAPAPRLLDEPQRRLLASLAEVLVPGAVAAGVVELIERVAAAQSAAAKRRLFDALGHFDRESRSAHGVRWLDLDEPTRLGMLQAVATGPGRPLPPTWTPGQPVRAASTATPTPATFRDHFEYLRMLVATTYFATEAGAKERGWTGRTAWKELPGCPHPEAEHE
jgi:hypothetical protein